MSRRITEQNFKQSALDLLAAVQALEQAAAEWLTQAAGLSHNKPELHGVGGPLNRLKLQRELRELVLRELPTVDLGGHKHARSKALVNGARLAGLELP